MYVCMYECMCVHKISLHNHTICNCVIIWSWTYGHTTSRAIECGNWLISSPRLFFFGNPPLALSIYSNIELTLGKSTSTAILSNKFEFVYMCIYIYIHMYIYIYISIYIYTKHIRPGRPSSVKTRTRSNRSTPKKWWCRLMKSGWGPQESSSVALSVV